MIPLADLLTIIINSKQLVEVYNSQPYFSILSIIQFIFRKQIKVIFIKYYRRFRNIPDEIPVRIFNPDSFYTKRPVIEFIPVCFILNQENATILIESIQLYIDKKLASNVNKVAFDLTHLTNIDLYFIRVVSKLLDNAINQNNGLLLKIILVQNIPPTDFLFKLNTEVSNLVQTAINDGRIQTNTIKIVQI